MTHNKQHLIQKHLRSTLSCYERTYIEKMFFFILSCDQLPCCMHVYRVSTICQSLTSAACIIRLGVRKCLIYTRYMLVINAVSCRNPWRVDHAPTIPFVSRCSTGRRLGRPARRTTTGPLPGWRAPRVTNRCVGCFWLVGFVGEFGWMVFGCVSF